MLPTLLRAQGCGDGVPAFPTGHRSHVLTASGCWYPRAWAGASLRWDLAGSLMLGLRLVKQSRLVFCCGSHQTRAVGYFCFYRENRPMTSEVYFNCGSTLTASRCVLTQCGAVCPAGGPQGLLCAGCELKQPGTTLSTQGQQPECLGGGGGGGTSPRGAGYGRKPCCCPREVTDVLSLEEEKCSDSRGERGRCPRQRGL